jgi:DNA-binding protein H-NS
MSIPSKEGNNMNDKNKAFNMIDEFHVMFMYRKIQAEAAKTDLKTLNQLLNKFRKVVAERREEYYLEIGEKKAQELSGERLQKIWGKMKRDRVLPEDLIDR